MPEKSPLAILDWCLLIWVWVTVVADLVLAGITVLFISKSHLLDRVFVGLPQVTALAALLFLIGCVACRSPQMLKFDLTVLAGITLALLGWLGLIWGSLRGQFAGLVVLFAVGVWGVVALVHASRVGAVWRLMRRGQWLLAASDASAPAPVQLSLWMVFGVMLAAGFLCDVGRWNHLARQRSQSMAIYQTQQQNWNASANRATDGFLRAIETENEAEIARQRLAMSQLRFVATEMLLRRLTGELAAANERVAVQILDVLAEDDPQSRGKTSAWLLHGYPDPPHRQAAEFLVEYAGDTSRPLALRQKAVTAAFRLCHGWYFADELLLRLAAMPDPSFAAPPLAAWLQRPPDTHHRDFPGRTAVCQFLGNHGSADAETLAALDYAAALPNPGVAQAAADARAKLLAK